MDTYKRIQAIEVLQIETYVPVEEIETYSDYELEAWLYELGYDWNGGSWVEGDGTSEPPSAATYGIRIG